jgi:hypothetical protein
MLTGVSPKLVVAGLLLLGCSKKVPECNALIESMNDLGTKLAEAQKVTGNTDSKPEQVAAALRPFAAAAKGTGDKLAQGKMTVPEIKKIADDASKASLALGASAANMADAADKMKGMDAAGKAVEEQHKVIDGAEAEIKKACEAKPGACTKLAEMLTAVPKPPDKNSDAKLLAEWSGKLTKWTSDLATVEIKDDVLKTSVATFEKGWKAFAAAMTTLVGVLESAKQFDDANKAFNGQIDQVNKAISDANAFCKAP